MSSGHGRATAGPTAPRRRDGRPARGAAGPGAYLHVPFCAHRCDYCAFATWTDRGHLMADYVEGCLTEIARARAAGELDRPGTVFVGGGTPSLLPPGDLARLIEALDPATGAEVTVECNPESASRALFERLAASGVTRISLGAQSMREHVLAGLGRHHSPGALLEAVGLVGDVGFASFNVDLVFGGAGETDDDWLASLHGVLTLDPPPQHVSAYALTVEPGTPLWHDPARHPDDDVLARRYEAADDVLSASGRRWYEISSWALPGHECAHNRLYWSGGEYRGFGCAAHSHLGGRRSWNLRTPERYLAAIRAGRSAVAGYEELPPAERAAEEVALALRTREGVAAARLEPAALADPSLAGLVAREGENVTLTRRGRLLANEVTLRLTASAS